MPMLVGIAFRASLMWRGQVTANCWWRHLMIKRWRYGTSSVYVICLPSLLSMLYWHWHVGLPNSLWIVNINIMPNFTGNAGNRKSQKNLLFCEHYVQSVQ